MAENMSVDVRTVYVSGPISSLPIEKARANFNRTCEKLYEQGFTTINPFEVVPECDQLCGSDLRFEDGSYQHTWECYLRYDIIAMLRCDAIYMMSGWTESKGARLELYIAERTGLVILNKSGIQGL